MEVANSTWCDFHKCVCCMHQVVYKRRWVHVPSGAEIHWRSSFDEIYLVEEHSSQCRPKFFFFFVCLFILLLDQCRIFEHVTHFSIQNQLTCSKLAALFSNVSLHWGYHTELCLLTKSHHVITALFTQSMVVKCNNESFINSNMAANNTVAMSSPSTLPFCADLFAKCPAEFLGWVFMYFLIKINYNSF